MSDMRVTLSVPSPERKATGKRTVAEVSGTPIEVPLKILRKLALSPAEEEELLQQEISVCADMYAGESTKQTLGTLQLGLMCPQPPFAMAHDATSFLKQWLSS